MIRVVHCEKESYQIYIGRPSKWGNPFTHIKDKDTLAEHVVATREEALERYREHLINNDVLMNSLDELENKILGCWCITDSDNPPHPYVCHGQILNEVITKQRLKRLSL